VDAKSAEAVMIDGRRCGDFDDLPYCVSACRGEGRADWYRVRRSRMIVRRFGRVEIHWKPETPAAIRNRYRAVSSRPIVYQPFSP